ncbi:four helix bundle protein [Patescibacteria group bacterium]|nr:four helix bundle protein [Patescibacteria group bacterium]
MKFKNGFRKLIVWQESHKFTLMIYRATLTFPKEEKFGITSQLRRAASSIGAQIVEGSRMSTAPHRKIYYERAYASAAEVDNFLELASDLGYLNEEIYKQLLDQLNCVSFLLFKLIKSCSSKTPVTTIPS